MKKAILEPPLPAEHFELKHSLINLVTSKRFFGFEKEDPHAHIGYFNKITYTSKYKYMPESSIKLMFFPFSIDGPARIWLDKEPSRSILTWDDLVSQFINHFFPPLKTTNLRNEISNFQQLATPSDLEKFKKTNEASRQAMRNHISNLKSELRSEMQSTMQNQNNAFKNELTNDIKNMMASFFQINTASSSSSGSLPSNTIANPKEVKDDIFDPKGDIVLIEKLLNLDSTKDLPHSPNFNPLSGSTTSSSPRLRNSKTSDYSLEEFADELALIESFPPENDDNSGRLTIRATPDKNEKKISISNASLILEDFNPPLYELPFHKEVPGSETLLSFSSENEEKVFNPGILTSKGVHTSLLSELSHRDSKAFKVIKIFESPMEIFPCSYGEDIRVLDVPCLHFYPS
ncbi:reverse transcriptase domain-containing protein [Tanacetum coccineum]